MASTYSKDKFYVFLQLLQEQIDDIDDEIDPDINMPKMNGIEAAKAIRALDRDDAKRIPIVAMTADVFEESIKECRNAEMNGYLMKPVDVVKLSECISEFLTKI